MNARSRRPPLGAAAASVTCVAVMCWALLTLLTQGGPRSVENLGTSAVAATVRASGDAGIARSSVPPVPAGGKGNTTIQRASAPAGTAPAAPAPESPLSPGAAKGPVIPSPGVRAADLQAHDRSAAARDQKVPVRVVVEAVGIDSPVDPVGLRQDRQMDIPKDAQRAGWYRFGPTPGAAGSAVVAGHVDDHVGRPGSLARLHDVELGDEVVIEHADGTRTAYVVEARASVSKADLALERLFARDGEPILVLITCTGTWSPAERSYPENLVVTARPVAR